MNYSILMKGNPHSGTRRLTSIYTHTDTFERININACNNYTLIKDHLLMDR